MAAKTSRRDGIGEGEKRSHCADLRIQTLDEQAVLVSQHAMQPGPAHVAAASSVNGVGERHIVGRDRLGDGAGSSADRKKTPRNFLARADLRERAVNARVHVDFEGFFLRLQVAFEGHKLIIVFPGSPSRATSAISVKDSSLELSSAMASFALPFKQLGCAGGGFPTLRAVKWTLFPSPRPSPGCLAASVQSEAPGGNRRAARRANSDARAGKHASSARGPSPGPVG